MKKLVVDIPIFQCDHSSCCGCTKIPTVLLYTDEGDLAGVRCEEHQDLEH